MASDLTCRRLGTKVTSIPGRTLPPDPELILCHNTDDGSSIFQPNVKTGCGGHVDQTHHNQNVEVTWNRFKSLANPFLASVQTRLGLSDYKLILDNTTTTPDLVDRNIVYAKIFLKPAKAIEYIALDFVITNQGAAFED